MRRQFDDAFRPVSVRGDLAPLLPFIVFNHLRAAIDGQVPTLLDNRDGNASDVALSGLIWGIAIAATTRSLIWSQMQRRPPRPSPTNAQCSARLRRLGRNGRRHSLSVCVIELLANRAQLPVLELADMIPRQRSAARITAASISFSTGRPRRRAE